jgi:hypothetical protein
MSHRINPMQDIIPRKIASRYILRLDKGKGVAKAREFFEREFICTLAR